MSQQMDLFDSSNKCRDELMLPRQEVESLIIDKDTFRTSSVLIPPAPQFYFNQTYDIESILLGRYLRELGDITYLGNRNRKELSSKLSIPYYQLEAVSAFAIKVCLSTSRSQLLPFGQLVVGNDPHLLNPGILWFLHFMMCSNVNIVFWSRLFNNIYYQTDNVASGDVSKYYPEAIGRMKESVFKNKAGKEFRSILQTYSNSLFKSLGLVIKTDIHTYTVITDEFSIPCLIWLASILVYRDRYYPGAVSLETRLIIDAHFSPGRLFRQNEQQVRKVLDKMHSLGLITVERSLGLDQVRFKNEHTWLSAISAYLQEGK